MAPAIIRNVTVSFITLRATPALGPYGPYRDSFRGAYLRGYDQGFNRR